MVALIRDAGLAEGSRVVLEKPFGTDLASARELNATVHSVFDEEQIFRIDHFLGKEAAQNILAMRFANGLFEPIWNCNHIDHVQIDVPETLSVGERARFYEGTGAFRDMAVSICSRCSRSSRWNRRPSSRRPRSVPRRTRCSARCDRSIRPRWSGGSTRATARTTGSPKTRRPRP